jgi:hypothetical protein
LIIEEHNATPASPAVTVIWDEWRPLSFEDRFDMIREAYRQVEGETVAEGLDIVSGFTPEEARAAGYLPYRVIPKWQKSGRHKVLVSVLDQENRVEAEEAKRTVLGEGADELRYIRKEDAAEAVKRLRAALPGSQWVVVHDEDED